MHNVGDGINAALDKEDWKAAKRKILAALEKEPDSHWLLSRLSAVYYEQRDYQKALEYARKAKKIAPECPLVLWDLAGALLATGATQDAFRIYQKILKGGVAKASSCPHGKGEGRKWAISLLIDSLFMAGVCSQRLENKERALSYFLDFLKSSEGWKGCIHTRQEAEKRIDEINADSVSITQEIERAKQRLTAV